MEYYLIIKYFDFVGSYYTSASLFLFSWLYSSHWAKSTIILKNIFFNLLSPK